MTCRQILTDHPKERVRLDPRPGREVPLLVDDKNEVLSMAPIINSATLGAVQVGDRDLLVEMTGTDMPSLVLRNQHRRLRFRGRRLLHPSCKS